MTETVHSRCSVFISWSLFHYSTTTFLTKHMHSPYIDQGQSCITFNYWP